MGGHAADRAAGRPLGPLERDVLVGACVDIGISVRPYVAETCEQPPPGPDVVAPRRVGPTGRIPSRFPKARVLASAP